jgi:membrane protease YdiL (CAAX protease family)
MTALWGGSAVMQNLFSTQVGKLIVSAVVILALVLLGFNRQRMFLVRGNLRAPIKPVVWMGFPKPDSWLSFGGQWSVYLALGVGAALWITSRTPLSRLLEVSLPLLPVILLLAALNAFNEEVVFRSGILSTTEESVSRMHAWGISALYFGIAHFW